MELFSALLIIVIVSIVIMFACDSFDDAASYLGRNMAPGVRGATINAVGSSMPELLTAFFLLFFYLDQDGFAAGIATTAGSAVFNAVVIPAVCIFAIRYRGVLAEGVAELQATREKIRSFEISKSNLLRDGFFLLVAEATLIWFLGDSKMTWWMGLTMLGIYGMYFFYLAQGFGSAEDGGDDSEDKDEDDASEEPLSKFKAVLTLNFNALLFNGSSYSTRSAWVVLSLATGAIAIACWYLAKEVIVTAEVMGVPTYFTALVFAAAATSVPDTVLSVKDAMRGDYDDALSNAIGSNTFDITVGLGLPLLLYTLIFGVDVNVGAADETQVLRIVLFAVTVSVLATLLLRKRVTVGVAYFLSTIYIIWMGYVIVDQVKPEWISGVVSMFA